MTTEILSVAPTTFEFEQVFNDESFVDAAGGIWSAGRTGNRWRLTLTFNNLTGPDRRKVWGHIAELRGRRNRLTVNMSTLAHTNAGVLTGSPLTDGVQSPGSTSIILKSAPVSVADWIEAGDWISVDGQLKMCTKTAGTTGGGAVTVQIWPEVHEQIATDVAPSYVISPGTYFLVESSGLGGVPHPADDAGSKILSQAVTMVLEQSTLR